MAFGPRTHDDDDNPISRKKTNSDAMYKLLFAFLFIAQDQTTKNEKQTWKTNMKNKHLSTNKKEL